MNVAELPGTTLGQRSVSFDDRDVMLYALATGAPADDLDLVYERDLRVLPTFGLTLGLWAVEAAGDLGAYDRMTSLHAAQRMEVRDELPTNATVDMSAAVENVWDKGKAALVDIRVDCAWFSSVYSIFLPGLGGFGGERGSSPVRPRPEGVHRQLRYRTSDEQAVLYRLTGDRHPVHVDPVAARAAGMDRPILHGLCTLGISARLVAAAAGAHPTELRALEARFAAPVLPGDELGVSAVAADGTAVFDSVVGERQVLTAGYARFG